MADKDGLKIAKELYDEVVLSGKSVKKELCLIAASGKPLGADHLGHRCLSSAFVSNLAECLVCIASKRSEHESWIDFP